MANHYSIILAEPNPFLREKIAGILSRQKNVWCVLQVGTREGLLRGSLEHQPNLILADTSILADRTLVARLRNVAPRTKLVLLVESESRPYVSAADAFGVDGLIAKAHLSDEIQRGMRALFGPGFPVDDDAGPDGRVPREPENGHHS